MHVAKLLSSTLLITIASVAPLCAQDGRPATDVATPAPGGAMGVNTEAWDSFISFNGQRIFGKPSDQQLIPAVTYFTSFTSSGKRIAKNTIVPSFSTSGPMFGGQGYMTIQGVIPFESEYVAQFNTNGGWKYNLVEWLDIDVGGGFAFYDENSFGEGQANPNGSYYRSKIYLGFIGKMLFDPAAYVVYDSQLQQVNLVAGLSETYEISDDWSIFGEGRFGYLSSQSYFGDSRSPISGKWSNGYAYWLLSADIQWTPFDGAALTAGIGYTGNNDGTVGVDLIDMGPENTVYGKFSFSYSF
ncbi:MAG: hypothetical protein ACQKBV_02655 [Puniceicoccales bacterium]